MDRGKTARVRLKSPANKLSKRRDCTTWKSQEANHVLRRLNLHATGYEIRHTLFGA